MMQSLLKCVAGTTDMRRRAGCKPVRAGSLQALNRKQKSVTGRGREVGLLEVKETGKKGLQFTSKY